MDINGFSNVNLYKNKMETSNLKKTQDIKNKLEQSDDDKKLLKAAEGFEAEFMKILIKEMRDTVPESDFMPKSSGQKMIEDMYFEKMAEDSPKGNGTVGLAKMLYDQLKRDRLSKIENK